MSLVGWPLLTVGAFGAYWLGFVEASFAAFIAPGLFLATGAAILFGLGTWRAGVAPRAGALLLVVGGPALFVLSELASLGGGLVLIYLAWVVLGHSLWSERIASERGARAVEAS